MSTYEMHYKPSFFIKNIALNIIKHKNKFVLE